MDRPTEFIPRPDETEYIHRVEPDYPTTDPDDYSARRGSFDGLGGNGVNGMNGRGRDFDDTVVGANDLTMVHPLDTSLLTANRMAHVDQPDDRPPVRVKDTGRTALRVIGEVLITLGMVVLLFVVYEVYITNIFSAQKQANATSALDKEWGSDTVTGGAGPQRSNHFAVADGHGIAKLYIPALGHDFHFTVIEGITPDDLAIGPGHYPGSALPGQPGDFAVAGHRVGMGAPFDDLGLVQSCDAIVIETQSDWYVYRTLPMSGEVAGWAGGKGLTNHCAGPNGDGKVQPLTGLYTKTVGQEIVLPSEGDVVAPVPHHPNAQLSAGQEVSLLTLTTCNPKFSAAQRMIVHAVLVKDWQKDPANANQTPPELKETS
ncbi:MAG TPA: class E sortase [Pseudonocardiaceae bacterium]|nr:class E sortase [Pseudonocardiaceae bacterium]